MKVSTLIERLESMKKIDIALSVVCVVAGILLGSCSPKVLTNTVEVIRTEREIVRDTTIVTQADSAAIHALFECDSTNQVVLRQLETLQGERIKPTVIIKHTDQGADVQFDCKEDSLQHEIEIRDKIIEEKSKEKEQVAVPYVPDYYKRTSTGFWVLLVILIIIVGFKAYKIYVKIQSGGLL